jgi:nucleotide-binding universal stress UspA family protein
MIRLERILAPTDFSDCSKLATEYACELSAKYSATLHVLHAFHPPAMAEPYLGLLIDDPEFPQRIAQKQLDEWNVPAFEMVSEIERAVREGVPFVEIVRYAREHEIDLCVIGTHGRTGLLHALIGSVAEKVVRKSPCPVLTVRPKGHQFVMP